MSLLTLVGISPLIGALIVLLIPAKKSELIKRTAFIITLLIALFSIFDLGAVVQVCRAASS